ncbi:hypothetical protein C6503_07280 [Candidatus Poribacteria bacterium]|nr:MAG: hypothetical protein C6503_07280 [Candidatus Poribacteria bacterium]
MGKNPYCGEQRLNTPGTELNRILEIIGRIAETTADGDFIYRGEPEHYEKVSSSLWRECKNVLETEEFDIEAIQKRMLEASKDYTHEEDDFEILTELQHYGGHTNLIDFTTDNHIALFFACDGSPDKPGRIILFQRTEEINEEYKIRKPQNPRNRVIAQKSIFVQPPKGFLDLKKYEVIDTPQSLKEPMLDHLQKQHGISTQAVYNDLHGFIRNQSIHQKTYIEGFRVGTQPKEDVFQIAPSQPSDKKEM